MLSAYVVLAAILCLGIANQELWNGGYRIYLDLPLLISSNFCAATAMIRLVLKFVLTQWKQNVRLDDCFMHQRLFFSGRTS